MRNSVLKQTIRAVIFLITANTALSGQNKIIEVWNGKVPGEIKDPNYKQIVDSAHYIKLRNIVE